MSLNINYNNENEESNNKDEGFNVDTDFKYSYDFHVKALSPYPTKAINKKNGKLIDVESDMISIRASSPDNIQWLNTAENIDLILHLLVLSIIIYVPVLSFRTIRSIVKNEIFEIKNIRRIRRIGYSLLICFICVFASEYISTYTAKEIFELENYRVVFKLEGGDNIFFMIGLISLLFAEILKISLKMKEENDLTV